MIGQDLILAVARREAVKKLVEKGTDYDDAYDVVYNCVSDGMVMSHGAVQKALGDGTILNGILTAIESAIAWIKANGPSLMAVVQIILSLAAAFGL